MLRQRGKKQKLNQMLRKYESVFIMYEKRSKFSWIEDNKEMTIIDWQALYYTFGMSGIN